VFSGMIFDLDGVIADTHSIHRQAWRQLLLENGYYVTEEELDFILEGHKRDDILSHFFGTLPTTEMLRLGRRKDELFLGQSAAGLRPIAGVVNFLDELDIAGAASAVATSASKHRAHMILERLGLATRFRGVVTGDDVSKGKPDPSVFHLAAECLHVRPEELLVAEDSAAGVRAAKSAGMKCLGIASGALAARLYQEGADCVVPGFGAISTRICRTYFTLRARRLRSNNIRAKASGCKLATPCS
jgi:beta-phosphoglucomutase